jgi:hypothetical protein
MSNLRAAAQQALEFVTSKQWGTTPYMDIRVYEDAARLRDSLRAALKQPEPCDIAEDGVCEALECCKEHSTKCGETVAWTLSETLDKRETTTTGYLWFSDPQNSAWTPLYTHPPSQRSENLKSRDWRGLTAGEIGAISDSIERSDFFDIVIPFGRAIEAALKERNA